MIYIGSFFFKTGSAVSGTDEDAVDRGGRREFPDESMFTAAAADDEDAEGGHAPGKREISRLEIQREIKRG